MQMSQTYHRRHFLRLTATFSTGALLAGCGGGGGADSTATDAIVVVPGPVAAAPIVAPASQSAHPLNLALNLAYIGAQYYGFAARGTGLATNLTSGVGQAGTATGARQANFGDTMVAGYAAELADDKQGHVVALRAMMGPLAAAQPALDLSTGSTGAFSLAAQGAGMVGAGAAFDPYSSDDNFLLGAFLVENTVAAAYRTLLVQTVDEPTTTLISANLADSIYHGGLIRALLDDKAADNASIGTALGNASALFAALDGSNTGDQTLTGSTGASSNLLDADGRPIPFTRANAQILKTLYLSSSGVGGFMPAGANGII
jgi:hypothetical protein